MCVSGSRPLVSHKEGGRDVPQGEVREKQREGEECKDQLLHLALAQKAASPSPGAYPSLPPTQVV